ncbi:uncharacterized protein BXZ73DRAFT_106066 [Epithele typhae]|uniref:uncharacterized protein n=1 Tax=Epithele typhae TaxID=378194 RepID=UPI002007564F|nr:uncharacterized protein BXZ73DRAFT_106066 [Epithele typhae]KAH9915787.1 hypothetical protein BXZ73DRAFT_106066 [Epithele typhae]
MYLSKLGNARTRSDFISFEVALHITQLGDHIQELHISGRKLAITKYSHRDYSSPLKATEIGNIVPYLHQLRSLQLIDIRLTSTGFPQFDPHEMQSRPTLDKLVIDTYLDRQEIHGMMPRSTLISMHATPEPRTTLRRVLAFPAMFPALRHLALALACAPGALGALERVTVQLAGARTYWAEDGKEITEAWARVDEALAWARGLRAVVVDVGAD